MVPRRKLYRLQDETLVCGHQSLFRGCPEISVIPLSEGQGPG
ncbi:hypothetical protein HMPREF1986_02859 [Oribacterium sp. oral taxon 078 str. F0263]|nr:hypothetical protein HMPREF1986_02859 [Oribacterium sp. oral taxon 078 str. F0263]